MNCKMIHAAVNTSPPTFQRSQCIRTERRLFVSVDWNFLVINYKIRAAIFLSYPGWEKMTIYLRLVLRNLYESINRNFIQVFWCFVFSAFNIFCKKIYFSFIFESNFTCSSYVVAISLMIKCRNRISCEKLRKCNANLYNLSCNLN